MPFFSNYADPDKENQAPGQNDTSVTHGASGGGADSTAPASQGTQAGASSGASQANAAKTGSQYQSIDNYLNANAGSGFGDQITGKVKAEQDKGYADQNAASQAFGNQVQGANQVPTQDQINGAVANPASANAAQYQKWQNQSYAGPTSLASSPALSNLYNGSAQTAQKDTNALAGNDSGQYSLLNSYFGTGHPGYGSPSGPTGQQALDLSIAQSGPGFGQQVGQLQQGAANLQQAGNQGQAQLQNLASQQAGNVEASANYAKNAVGGAIGGLESTINQGVTDANTKAASDYAALQKQLGAGQPLTAAQDAQYGIDPTQNTYGTLQNLGQYFSQGPALTAANVMTPEQQAQLRALQNLSGPQASDTLGQTTLQAPPTNSITYNGVGENAAVSANKAAYDNDLGNKQFSSVLGNFTIPQMQQKLQQYNQAFAQGNTSPLLKQQAQLLSQSISNATQTINNQYGVK